MAGPVLQLLDRDSLPRFADSGVGRAARDGGTKTVWRRYPFPICGLRPCPGIGFRIAARSWRSISPNLMWSSYGELRVDTST
jgi:hypothetical protein